MNWLKCSTHKNVYIWYFDEDRWYFNSECGIGNVAHGIWWCFIESGIAIFFCFYLPFCLVFPFKQCVCKASTNYIIRKAYRRPFDCITFRCFLLRWLRTLLAMVNGNRYCFEVWLIINIFLCYLVWTCIHHIYR